MKITRNGTIPSKTGPEAYFSGHVRMDMAFTTNAPSRVGGVTVSFEPGARTAWHTHPLGQTVIITSGAGWAQIEGEDRQDIRPGDIVWFPPGVRHWHGATDKTAMTHIAIHETLDGSNADWQEHVSDADYLGG